MLDQVETSADGAPSPLLPRIRAAVAVSAAIAAGLSLMLLVEEAHVSGLGVGAAAVAGVHALVLAALRGPSPSAGLRAAQAIGGAPVWPGFSGTSTYAKALTLVGDDVLLAERQSQSGHPPGHCGCQRLHCVSSRR